MVIEFEDSGPGFPEGALVHVFEPFFTTRNAVGGSGVGLTLCHRIVTSLGGAIRAENPATGGALIRISLPAAAPPSGRRDDSRTEACAVRRRILVIDDVAPLRRAMAGLLENHDVGEAEDGDAAIAILRADPAWNLILCDVLMPNGSGRDVYEFATSEVPWLVERIVFTTGGADHAAAADFLGTIPNRVLHKPIEPDALLELAASLPPRDSSGQ